MATNVEYIITGTYTPFMVFVKENGIILESKVIQNSGTGGTFQVPDGLIYDLEVYDTFTGFFTDSFTGNITTTTTTSTTTTTTSTTTTTTTTTTVDPCAAFGINSLVEGVKKLTFNVTGTGGQDFIMKLFNANDLVNPITTSIETGDGAYEFLIPIPIGIVTYIVTIEGQTSTSIETCSATDQITIGSVITTTTTLAPNPLIFVAVVPQLQIGETNISVPYISGDADIYIRLTTDSNNTQYLTSATAPVLTQDHTFTVGLNNDGNDVQFQILGGVNLNNVVVDTTWTGTKNANGLVLPSGYNEGFLRIRVRTSTGSALDWQVNISNSVSGWGLPADSNDTEYVISALTYGYWGFNNNFINIVEGIVQ